VGECQIVGITLVRVAVLLEEEREAARGSFQRTELRERRIRKGEDGVRVYRMGDELVDDKSVAAFKKVDESVDVVLEQDRGEG
jgi:hypothetical protein